MKSGQCLWRKFDAHNLLKKSGCLCCGAAQLLGADLQHLPARPQAWQGRVSTGQNDEMQLRRLMRDEKLQRGVDRRIVHQGKVVQDQHIAVSRLAQTIDDGGQHLFKSRHAWRLQRHWATMPSQPAPYTKRSQRAN